MLNDNLVVQCESYKGAQRREKSIRVTFKLYYFGTFGGERGAFRLECKLGELAIATEVNEANRGINRCEPGDVEPDFGEPGKE